MMRSLTLVTITLAMSVSACQTIDEQAAATVGQAEISLVGGTSIGQARLYRTAQELTVNVALSRLQQNELNLTLETTGACSQAGDKRTLLAALPSATVGPNGSVTVSALLSEVPSHMLDQIFGGQGAAIIIATNDDPTSDLACGFFKAK